MANKLKLDWNNLWQRNNLGSTLGSLGAGFLGAFSVGKQNAQVKDTTEDEVLMDTIENTQLSSTPFRNNGSFVIYSRKSFIQPIFHL